VRVAVTGSTGRLGRAVLAGIEGMAGWSAVPWTRRDLDLDAAAPATVGAALEAAQPGLVIHCAAWTDVDGCAREPELAARRNGAATGALATACAERGIGLVAISTNEVFDGRRTDGRAYGPGDPTSPPNAYGRSKLLGEDLARAAFARAEAPLWIVRTAWLFGPPGNDFPSKIARAARSAADAGRPLQLVADEVGCPTACRDLAGALVDLAADPGTAGLHHVVNAGWASRAEWARGVLAQLGIDAETVDVPMDTWPRASEPPRWGVLEPTPLPTLGALRSWQAALADDLARRTDLREGTGAAR
jgi:dTDP-4-dehydrorhamnose reductase